nr:NACHT, LRR and PYD domains-containing protein 3-like isoform X2 [Danio rerio]|eukprot:XP_021328745.1 NACHT, LRR and PYD domains-containing protein 3-like isoform X2 [Danio rerio]
MNQYEKREKESLMCEAASPEPSCVSMKSDASLPVPPNLSDGALSSDSDTMNQHEKSKKESPMCEAASQEPSCVSIKSYGSLPVPPNLSDGALSSDFEVRKDNVSRAGVPHLTYQETFIKQNKTETLQRIINQHKTSMKNRYERLFEGIKLDGNQTLLNRIYTQLYIIEGESKGVKEEHEILLMEKIEKMARMKGVLIKTQYTPIKTQDIPIHCNSIFKPLHKPTNERFVKERKDQIKTVLTKGIAGIGKTVSVQKFILDWSEGKASQDVDFMFVLPFRELNLIKDHQYSLHTLLLDFHPKLQDLDSEMYEECKVVFIFDGLDESRIPLKFSDRRKVSDVNESSSVAVLMSNLIRGDLLPSAHIWITSRPAAANQIPSKYINRLTEIQGFNDSQKEEYFRKRISDVGQARRIISHIRRSRSLQIMCHIPVFCWISATVLQKLLNKDDRAEIPQTLTEMYIHFLLTQINMRNLKYEKRDPEKLLKSSKDMIVKLAELAFKQLMKGNVMFYEEDLIESGIDITDASVYSGICTEIFKEESVIHQRKVYSFIHLSFQEFLAALFLFYSYAVKKRTSLKLFLSNVYDLQSHEISLYDLLKSTVKKSLRSRNGHLDLFLRFLLGVFLESNQRLLKDLLTYTEKSSESIKRITQYIKDKLKTNKDRSAGRCINLFLCLLEIKDQTLYREIQDFVKSQTCSEEKLSLSYCSAIAYMLLISEEVLDEFDLKKYNTSDGGKRRLIPAVVNCRKAVFAGCNLTAQCCESLFSSLQSSNSLRELDLSNNDLQDSGVKLLSDGLKSSHCQLEKLRLTSCQLSGQCCESLSSFLQSSNSMRELDLSNNDLQDSGVKLLSDVLKSSHCQLEILRLSGCMVTEVGCCFLASALRLNPSHLRELDLSYNHPGESLAEMLDSPSYRLDTLNVDHGAEFRITTGPQKYAFDLTLDVNTAHVNLALSEGNRKVTRVAKKQSYPDHPERFDEWCQVLSRESLTGRCYWEAEFSGRADVAVTYRGIRRKGLRTESLFGFNEKSWNLNCFDNKFIVRHKNTNKDIDKYSKSDSNRVGVYLDRSAGTLSFYSVSDTHTLKLLHTFNTTFTEPLYAGFGVFSDGSVSLLCNSKASKCNNKDTQVTYTE